VEIQIADPTTSEGDAGFGPDAGGLIYPNMRVVTNIGAQLQVDDYAMTGAFEAGKQVFTRTTSYVALGTYPTGTTYSGTAYDHSDFADPSLPSAGWERAHTPGFGSLLQSGEETSENVTATYEVSPGVWDDLLVKRLKKIRFRNRYRYFEDASDGAIAVDGTTITVEWSLDTSPMEDVWVATGDPYEGLEEGDLTLSATATSTSDWFYIEIPASEYPGQTFNYTEQTIRPPHGIPCNAAFREPWFEWEDGGYILWDDGSIVGR